MSEYGFNILRDNGFKIVVVDGKVTGFQIRVTVSYYRGIQLSQVGGYRVFVDGEEFGMDKITMSIDGENFYNAAQLAQMSDVSWDFGVRAYLRIEKPGGLSRGRHIIKVMANVMVPYLGPNGIWSWQTRDMTMVAPEVSEPDSPIQYGVSLYSYQIEQLNRQLTLEEMFEEVRDLGADGIEIIPQAQIPDFWNMSDEFVENWHYLLNKYNLKPIAFDSFCEENTLYKLSGRVLTLDEKIDIQKKFMDQAVKLGFRKTRSQMWDPKILEAMIPYAEEKDLVIGIEIHQPMKIKSDRLQGIIDMIEKTGSKYLRLVPDFGIWQKIAPHIILEMHTRDGAHWELIKLAQELTDQGVSRDELFAKIREKGGCDADIEAAGRIFGNSYDNPEDLKDIVPYISHIHGKVWQMEEDLEECSIDYANPLRVLLENGWRGYINSEYEGGRHTQGAYEVRGIEQVRRHQAMIRNYVTKYTQK